MGDIVVCCSDGSDVSTRAIRAGLALLDRQRWQVVLAISVPEVTYEISDGVVPGTGPGVTPATLGLPHLPRNVVKEQEQLIDMGVSRARGVADQLGLDESCIEVLVGKPGPVLVDYLREKEAGLAVLGTRGLGGAARLFLGSVSDHVLQHSPCPVLVGGEELPAEPTGPIVLCVDESERSVEAGRIAVGLFAPDLPAAVAMVRPVPDVELGNGVIAEDLRRSWAEQADQVLTAAATAIAVPDTELVALDGAEPAHALAAYAKEHPVRCFVVGSHGRGAVGRAMLGSVATRLVKLSPAMVCVVPRRK
ncbi:universal stress protein [Raineyella antarctica]|nr:universal stress protein [Raineyella antarctica]